MQERTIRWYALATKIPNPVLLRRRILVAVIVFAATATCSWFAQIHITHSPGGDFTWTMRAARDLVSGRDPYGYPPDAHHIPYPLPAVFVGLPYSIFSPAIGAALFFGVSAGLLAFGIRETRRLLIFAAMPFWFALIWAQWTPLIVASAFIPALGAVLLIKPHIALPVFATNFSRIRVYSCAAILVATVIVYPRWPFVWISQLTQYQKFFPILSFPLGPLLILALIKWRERDAWLLLLAALLPERAFYDAFTLWLIPKSRQELIVTVGLSWGAFIWRMFDPNANLALLSVAFLFLPMLLIILSRASSSNDQCRRIDLVHTRIMTGTR